MIRKDADAYSPGLSIPEAVSEASGRKPVVTTVFAVPDNTFLYLVVAFMGFIVGFMTGHIKGNVDQLLAAQHMGRWR